MSMPIEPDSRDMARRERSRGAEGPGEEREGSEEYFQAKQASPSDLLPYAWEEVVLPPPQEMGEDG